MSNSHRFPRRVRTAIVVAPLAVSLACASGRAAKPDAPAREAAGAAPVSDVAPVSGKTLENLFAGRFPGVSVTPMADGGLQIRIRGGNNSFYGSNEPLYLVDDTPVPESARGIVFLNPYDIEKIEVLKNPADIGVYGSRGVNGVVKITTMRPERP